MNKFTDHSIMLHPLSATTDTSFNKMGAAQTTVFNLRLLSLVETSNAPEITGTKGKDFFVRTTLYDEAQETFNKGLFLLRRNGPAGTRFEGTVIIPQIGINERTDAMTTLDIPELGHFSIDSTIKTDTVDLLKKIAFNQRKTINSIYVASSHIVASDTRVRFELARASIKEAFMLRIRNL